LTCSDRYLTNVFCLDLAGKPDLRETLRYRFVCHNEISLVSVFYDTLNLPQLGQKL
jgi:hypothetical protein